MEIKNPGGHANIQLIFGWKKQGDDFVEKLEVKI
jgi:hypothetical protein